MSYVPKVICPFCGKKDVREVISYDAGLKKGYYCKTCDAEWVMPRGEKTSFDPKTAKLIQSPVMGQ